MSSTPITNPVVLLTTTLHDPLSLIVETVAGVPAWFWLRASAEATDALVQGALGGLLVVQAQTPLSGAGFVNGAEVTGSIVIRALALSDDGAQDLLAATTAILAAPLAAPDGYAVQLDWQAELVIPPTGGVYTAAATYALTLRRTP